MLGWLGAIIRVIVSVFVLQGVDFLLPNVQINGFINALMASITIAFLGYTIETILGEEISPEGRGLTGFLSSTIVIYATQLLLTEMKVTVIGSLLSALIIGVIDTFVPTELR